MEGLLPLVFRAIKKHKTRRKYQSLSSPGYDNISMVETYPLVQGRGYHNQEPSTQKNMVDGRAENFGHHRRYNSVGDFYDGFSTPHHQIARPAGGPADSKQLVRFRSHKLFSCVTGS